MHRIGDLRCGDGGKPFVGVLRDVVLDDLVVVQTRADGEGREEGGGGEERMEADEGGGVHVLVAVQGVVLQLRHLAMTPIPITVFTGFLGAGKTSAILSLLPQLPKDYKVVLLKNEFGDVQVDSQLAKQSSLTAVAEILNGCMCAFTRVRSFCSARPLTRPPVYLGAVSSSVRCRPPCWKFAVRPAFPSQRRRSWFQFLQITITPTASSLSAREFPLTFHPAVLQSLIDIFDMRTAAPHFPPPSPSRSVSSSATPAVTLRWTPSSLSSTPRILPGTRTTHPLRACRRAIPISSS